MTETANKLNPYIHLTESFLAHEIEAIEFERRYFSVFKSDASSSSEIVIVD